MPRRVQGFSSPSLVRGILPTKSAYPGSHLELNWVIWDFSSFFVLLLFFKFGSQEPLVNESLGL